MRIYDDQTIIDELLGPLMTHFAAADLAYRDYKDCGGAFLYACSLRRLNVSSCNLLIHKAHMLPEDTFGDAIELIRHYDAWLTLWDGHAAKQKPDFGDEFAFESTVRFPADAKQNLIKEFELLEARIPSKSVPNKSHSA